MNISKGLFSHQYALMRVLPVTTGDVLEMGIGIGSTPFLHWACYEKRRLVSYETNPKYYRLLKDHSYGLHEIHLIEDWELASIEKPWGVAFIDHAPNERRHVDVIRLKDYAKYIVIHDTNPKYDNRYYYSEIYPLFKYVRHYKVARTHVGVLSNFVDVGELPE